MMDNVFAYCLIGDTQLDCLKSDIPFDRTICSASRHTYHQLPNGKWGVEVYNTGWVEWMMRMAEAQGLGVCLE